jgi:acyl dehydratase
MQPHIYTECAQIWNPIHTEPDAAHRAGLEAIVLHGTCSFAMMIERAIDACCDGDPARIAYAAADFRGPVFPGTKLPVELRPLPSRQNRRRVQVRSGAEVLVSGMVAKRMSA